MALIKAIYQHHIFIKESISNIGTYAFIRLVITNASSTPFTYSTLLEYLNTKKELGGEDDGIMATGFLARNTTGDSPEIKEIIAVKRLNSSSIGVVTATVGSGLGYETTSQVSESNVSLFQDQIYLPMDQEWAEFES